ncbi:MAG: PAS domain S-box protein [Acidobacteria bacterium]|nr:PAS domain S-box protein [Acidobacteriota bacterium]
MSEQLTSTPRREKHGPGMAYGSSLVVLAAAVFLRYLLDPVMGDTLPLVTLFGAVAFAVWIGGYGPAAISAILGYFACLYLFIEPRGTFALNLASNLVGLAAYLFTCALIIGLGAAARVAERRAYERRELLRVTLASIGDAVITTDVEGRVTYLNAVGEALTGWPQRDAAGQPLQTVFKIVNEDTRVEVENPATKALRDGVVVGLANHTVLIRKDGAEHPIDDSAAPIMDELGHVQGCVLIFRDVSTQRGIERSKSGQFQTARLLASIVESSDDAIISKSLDGIIQSWNASAERLFGYTAQQAVGRHISLVIPPDRLAEEDRIVASLKAGERIDHFETERIRSDGRRIFVSLTISPLRDDEGTVIGASKIVRDITGQREAEHQLRRLAEDLSEADRRKNEFLAMLAHELRNPLAPISHAARALRMSGDRDTVQAAAAMLERQMGQMARLVDDLLDMSRITRGKIELRRSRIELAPVVQQAVEALRPQYKTMDVNLTVTVPQQPIYLDADPVRLAQVIGNLLSNGSKFTDAGGRVWLTVEPAEGEVAIRVRDTGIGIAAEQIPRLFEMFAQVDTSLERSHDGLGIGLTLVRALVEMHGGTVEATSDGAGLGSEFAVRLPALRPVSPPVTAPEVVAGKTSPVVGRRILVVDDSHDGAEFLALLLQVSGHETRTANDGPSAIEAAETFHPDVVLLDIGLPKMNGYEVCRHIRKQSWGRDMVLIALTGWGQEEHLRRSREAGFDLHMVKPVDHDALEQALASLPTRSQIGSETREEG